MGEAAPALRELGYSGPPLCAIHFSMERGRLTNLHLNCLLPLGIHFICRRGSSYEESGDPLLHTMLTRTSQTPSSRDVLGPLS